jgi:hypothetical protein
MQDDSVGDSVQLQTTKPTVFDFCGATESPTESQPMIMK